MRTAIEPGTNVPGVTDRPARPAIADIAESSDGDDLRVTIALDWLDERHYGAAVGSADVEHRYRLAAEAALEAVERLTGGRLDLELLAVATTTFGAVRIALAQVRLDADEILVGTAVERDDGPSSAAVKAVMDALNRRLGLLL